MECPVSYGPLQRAWIAAGYLFVLDDSLIFPIVFCTEGYPPLAAIPSFARGHCLEMMFGYCMADLRQQRVGWVGLVSKLLELSAPIASAILAATLAFGLNPWDGLNAIERIVYQAVRLVG